MSVYVLLSLSNDLEERDKMRDLLNILSLFRIDFNEINNTKPRKLDSICHITLRLL